MPTFRFVTLQAERANSGSRPLIVDTREAAESLEQQIADRVGKSLEACENRTPVGLFSPNLGMALSNDQLCGPPPAEGKAR